MPTVEDLAFLGWLDVYPVPCSGSHTKEQERKNILPRLMTISNRYLVIQHSLHRKVATRVMVFGVCNRENPAKDTYKSEMDSAIGFTVMVKPNPCGSIDRTM